MTEMSMSLAELIEKGLANDVLHKIIQLVCAAPPVPGSGEV